MVLTIFCILFIFVIIAISAIAIIDACEETYNKTFDKVKIHDRYFIKQVVDPFNVSDKQIAVILDKEKSTVNDKNYVLFVCNNQKFSCEWSKFKSCFSPITNNSHLKEVYIDTDVNENYKEFRDEYYEKITKKQNNITRW